MFDRRIRMGVERGVFGVVLQEAERFLDLFDQSFVTRGALESIEFLPSACGEDKLKHQLRLRTYFR